MADWLSFGVRWPCHRFVLAGHAGGLYTIDRVWAAGMAGEGKRWHGHRTPKESQSAMENRFRDKY